MAYRKIEVDNKEYEYVIGKTYFKIKNIGVFKISEWGIGFDHIINDPEATPIGAFGELTEMRFRVTPAIIERVIGINK